jgi:ribosome maturation factor RimP
MNLEQRISEKVESLLPSPLHFVVEVSLSASRTMPKLQVLLDGDEGIGIDDCVKVSRALGVWIEEEELINSAYNLEVSSPGIERPLDSVRLYKKNEGRKLKIVDAEGKTRKGKLLHANETGIEWEEEIKQQGKKKVELLISQLPYEQIKKCNVMVSFD